MNEVDILAAIARWGYVVIFIALYLENVALVGLFVPGVTILVSAGFIAGTGRLNPFIVAITAWLAVVLGDATCYIIGRFSLDRVPRIRNLTTGINPERLTRWPILFFQFPVPTRIGVPLLAGSVKVPALKALMVDIFATTIFVGAVGGIGYTVGYNAGSVAEANRFARIAQFVFLGMLIGIVIYISTRVLLVRRHRHAKKGMNDDGS